MIGVMRGYEFPEVDHKWLSNNGGMLEIPVDDIYRVSIDDGKI
jgi:hypothetical protein